MQNAMAAKEEQKSFIIIAQLDKSIFSLPVVEGAPKTVIDISF